MYTSIRGKTQKVILPNPMYSVFLNFEKLEHVSCLSCLLVLSCCLVLSSLISIVLACRLVLPCLVLALCLCLCLFVSLPRLVSPLFVNTPTHSPYSYRRRSVLAAYSVCRDGRPCATSKFQSHIGVPYLLLFLVSACAVSSCLVQSCVVSSCFVLSCRVVTCLVLSCLV